MMRRRRILRSRFSIIVFNKKIMLQKAGTIARIYEYRSYLRKYLTLEVLTFKITKKNQI